MRELVQLQEAITSFSDIDRRILAISLDPPADLKVAREKTGATFRFFSDESGVLADRLGLLHRGGNPMDGSDIARPAILHVDSDGRVIQSWMTDNYRVRPRPEEIFSALAAPQ